MKLTSTDRTALLAILDRFRRQKVVVLGDLVADESIYGEIARVSREAPVLILKQREKQVTPGGGANAVNNLADLGARVIPVGVVGDDEAGESGWAEIGARDGRCGKRAARGSCSE